VAAWSGRSRCLFWTGPDGTGMSWANASACVVAGILVPAYRAGGRWDVGRCTSFLGTDLLWRVLCGSSGRIYIFLKYALREEKS
jgi:hypothetical protein